MKKQLLLAAALFSLAAANTQGVIYEQDFEGNQEDLVTEGWFIAVASGDTDMFGVFDSMPAMEGIGFQGDAMGVATFTVGNQGPQHIDYVDVIIVTPVIELPQEGLRQVTG